MERIFDRSSKRVVPRLMDMALGLAGGSAAAVTLAVLGWMVWDLVVAGFPEVSWGFLTGEVEDAGRSGGIGPILVSTGMVLVCCLAVAVPSGLGCAFWLSEYARKGGAMMRWVIGCVDLLASVPSIVFGLFGMVFFCQVLGLGFSIMAGGLTLACMILPVVVRMTMAAMEAVPGELRLGSAALGMTRAATLWRVLLPAAVPGVVAGLMLGVGRALSETAALLFTSGYATRWPESVGDSGRVVSVHIYDLALNVPGGAANASASALVLLVVVLAINLGASRLAERWVRGRVR